VKEFFVAGESTRVLRMKAVEKAAFLGEMAPFLFEMPPLCRIMAPFQLLSPLGEGPFTRSNEY
jgi:hypothetical protein